MKFKFLSTLIEQEMTNIIYHASPVKFDPNDKFGKGYDELFDYVKNYDDEEDGKSIHEYKLLARTLKAYENGMGNVSSKQENQIYVSSQPEAWIELQMDELEITYQFGGIYALQINHPIKEHLVNAGMGMQLPEAIINTSDIIAYRGPFKSELEASKAFILTSPQK